MNAEELIDQLRSLIARHKGGERELYEALMNEASGWEMRLEELDAQDEDDDQ